MDHDSDDRFSLSQIGQLAFTVPNLDVAVGYYRDVLGLKYLFSAPPGLAFFELSGIRLMLSVPEKEGAVGNSIIYFKVRDIVEARNSLGVNGADIVDEPHMIARMPDHELWMFFIRDPFGNLLGIMSEKALSA